MAASGEVDTKKQTEAKVEVKPATKFYPQSVIYMPLSAAISIWSDRPNKLISENSPYLRCRNNFV